MSLILTNREKQKIEVDIGSIVNYNEEDIDYFNTITEIKLKNGHILEVLETEEQIEEMIYQYHNSNGGEKMRETWEKQKSDFIEVTEVNETIVDGKFRKVFFKTILNTKSIAKTEKHDGKLYFLLNSSKILQIKESYEEIKEMLGLQ